MCGIAVIYSYKSPSEKVCNSELIKIRDHMSNRGPDDAGLWVNKNIGMAHRRLSIVDISNHGHQPMETSDGKLRIVFNGEIYNYKKIRKDLEKKGYQFRTESDTEVLLHLYKEKGQGLLSDLRGMYAFAIWDDEKQGLFIARDPLGIKPLYYSDNGKSIRVASQVKALISGGGIDKKRDSAGLVGFYLWGNIPEPYTIYEKIKALPAGTSLWVNQNGAHKRKFFSIADMFSQQLDITNQLSHEEMMYELSSALSDSVNHHLIADVPVGVFLSAGLDSSTLTAHASKLSGRRLNTVTLGFSEYRGTVNDEVPLAESISRYYGTHHKTVWVKESNFREEADNLFDVMDQPSIDGINTYFVSKAAAESGLKVALSGVGGDEIFAGYPSFQQIPKMVNNLGFMEQIPIIGKGFRYVSAPIVKHFTSTKYAGLLEYGHNYSGAYLLRRGLYMPWELPEVLDPEIIKEGWQKLQPLIHLEKMIRPINNERLKISAMEMSLYMRNQLLRDADWAGMAHSLEIRTPLVDVELLKKLTPLLMLDHPPSKKNMATTFEKQLPESVINRVKTGFSVPVNEWMTGGQRKYSGRGLRGWSKLVMDKEQI
jgi:asparagine synthase (glutamine-hydrolysing)